jgi:hypothetical protein
LDAFLRDFVLAVFSPNDCHASAADGVHGLDEIAGRAACVQGPIHHPVQSLDAFRILRVGDFRLVEEGTVGAPLGFGRQVRDGPARSGRLLLPYRLA